jgi:GTPase SAR1 family protein/multidrug efflux pump subunit AcrA (membrane-fusion protein)
MTRTSPFKFLDSYQKDDLDIFFGREKETEKLYDALSGVKHLLVYGPSGAGKTSLIECGLRNQFSDADWFAITVRRGGDLNAAVFARICEQLREPFDLDPTTKLPADAGFEFGDAVERLFAEQYKPVYLLFDQFEELLIQGSDAEKQQFFTRLQRLIRYKTPCRILLIMREEFIGHLSEFEPLCPSLFQHRFRLEKMGRANVRTVIQQILEADKYRSAFRVEQPEHLANTILAKLPDTQREIELAHVQVFLGELWDRANASLKSEIVLHSGLVKEDDNLERVLDSFLKNQLQELAPAHGEKAPLELLAAMISERHTKLQLSAADLETALTKNAVALQQPLPDLLRELEQRRILRTLKSGEQTQYEIRHDVLARVVGQNLTEDMKLREKAREIYRVYGERKGLFSREDLDYLRAFEGYLGYSDDLKSRIEDSEGHLREVQARELEATKRRLRVVRGLLAAVFMGLLAAGYFWFDADRKTKEVEKAKIEAQQNLIESYRSDIKRFQNEIVIAERNRASFRLQNAEDDLIKLEAQKIDTLSQRILDLEMRIKQLEQ